MTFFIERTWWWWRWWWFCHPPDVKWQKSLADINYCSREHVQFSRFAMFLLFIERTHSSPWELWLGAHCTLKTLLALNMFLKDRFVAGVNFSIFTQSSFALTVTGYNVILHIIENNPYCRRQLPKSGTVNIYTGIPTVGLDFTSSWRITCMRSASFIDVIRDPFFV